MQKTLKLPEPLEPLRQLAYNLKWSWTPSTQALFSRINPDLWESSHHNPIAVLLQTSPDTLQSLTTDSLFVQAVRAEAKSLQEYLHPPESLESHPAVSQLQKRGPVAYFSAEYGIHESLPIYAGGLGILAGDHSKSASDLHIPLIGIGLMYQSGYFEQAIAADGEQIVHYPQRDFSSLPVEAVLDEEGYPLILDIPLPHRKLFFRVWKASVGRSILYLMDTRINTNREQDRELTAHLYGGDSTTRICQEMLLGVGGVRTLHALKHAPSVYHLNEGHAAFVGLELLRRQLKEDPGMEPHQALPLVRERVVFTTHTPVPAGHDRFMTDMVRPYLEAMFPEHLQQHIPYFLQLGLEYKNHLNSLFCMTVLALNTARKSNGVSKIHGEVSRHMWNHLWPSTPAHEVPIGHITNGIHAQTWISSTFSDLFDKHLGIHWPTEQTLPSLWEKIANIPTEELWAARQTCKQRLVAFVRSRVKQQRMARHESPESIAAVEQFLNPQALTIGFARRFAPYKRATLLFSDLDRLRAIVNHPTRPVQFLFAGKAHPHNREGMDLVRRVFQITQHPDFVGKIILLENYDMAVGRNLVQGVDVWLNNPTPPQEASGTSGQKVGFNGGINVSILDGWWPEGYNGTNGWAIGSDHPLTQIEQQNHADVTSLYHTLETQVIPLFYERDNQDLPQAWLQKIRHALQTLLAPFNTHRMLQDYLHNIYLP